MDGKRKVFLGVAWAVVVASGLVALFVMRRAREEAAREATAANWRPIAAKVSWADVHPQPRPWPLPHGYAVRMNYSYSVGGIYYTNTRTSFDGDRVYSSEAAAKAALPPTGKEITVFIDPLRPEESVAERDRHAFARSPAFQALMVAVALTELFLLLYASRKLRPKRQRPDVGGIRRT